MMFLYLFILKAGVILIVNTVFLSRLFHEKY